MIIKTFKNQNQFADFLEKVGVTPAGSMYMKGKGVLRIFDLGEIDTRGANILKQEALSIGAEVALPREAAAFDADKVRAVLIANLRQVHNISDKLKLQPFGLKEVGRNLIEIAENYERDEFVIKSPHGRELVLDRPVVMGVLNVTPDSFSDGGQWAEGSGRSAVDRAKEMAQEGAMIIDIGGESTGPGSKDVSLEEELARVIPVIEAVRKELPDVFISIDTWKSEVALKAIEAGADMVNDVTAGRGDAGMTEIDAPIVLMYAKDDGPRTTSDEIEYDDVIFTISSFLKDRITKFKSSQIIIDPGMGAFVSSVPKYSVEILHRLSELKTFGLPILVGASRKSFLGGEIEDRLPGSIAAATIAAQNGAKIIRAHDVKETFNALKLC